MRIRITALLVAFALVPAFVRAQSAGDIERIKDEGMNRSQVMQTLSYLSDVIGPRLTASPNMKRANEWTRDRLKEWGLYNAHLESWGPFGRGWSLHKFTAQVVDPQCIPVIAYPKAWSVGLKGPITADVVYMDAKSDEDLAKYKGKLKGAVVFISPLRNVPAHFESQGARWTDAQLDGMAGAGGAARERPRPQRDRMQNQFAEMRQRAQMSGKILQLAVDEGAAAVVDAGRGDGGTVFVQSATVPGQGGFFGGGGGAPGAAGGNRNANPGANRAGNQGAGAPTPINPPGNTPPAVNPNAPPPINPPGNTPPGANPSANGRGNRGNRQAAGQGQRGRMSPWSKDAPKNVPQITMAVEHYNRIVRMVQAGEKVRMAIDMQVKFHDDDLNGYNTVAEITGTDLKDEVVMLGGHMDSWHTGTGATDNGAGCAVAMEAVRIIQSLGIKPRRTVRIALWSGEEEGLMGSRAYVKEHFGSMSGGAFGGGFGAPPDPNMPPPKLETKPDYDKLSGYFNLDNGTGKIRGIYLQGNAGCRELFQQWLEPFNSMGAKTVTINNTGGTDHQSFDGIGLPGFQFIQDEIEYETRTHHSNMDVFDRIQADDMKQASTIMATFVYNTAMRDEKLPRKARPGSSTASTN